MSFMANSLENYQSSIPYNKLYTLFAGNENIFMNVQYNTLLMTFALLLVYVVVAEMIQLQFS